MSAALIVQRPGICSSLQDLGRGGFRAYGVPVSGALDPVASTLANLVVANEPGCATIEMMYSGIAVELQSGSARVAVVGAPATIERNGSKRLVEAWQSAVLATGETLRIGTLRQSAVAYLAVEGGFDAAPLLGSRSTYLRGALGGFTGRQLQRGDVLPLKQDTAAVRAERRLAQPPDLCAPSALRVILGPQADRFAPASIDLLLASEYTISASSDRSGLRLDGPALTHVGGHDLASEGVATGSIQVPGSGNPVILIGDHPTVGGYPKIATIISADIPAAGRLRIGSKMRFIAVDEATAAEARREAKRKLAEIEASIEASMTH